MVTLKIKPLSVNEAWKGRRFKTDKYDNYIIEVISLLPKLELPKPPYQLTLHFGFSNKASDIDNPIKNFTDCLQKYYKFNDKEIYRLVVNKEIVTKGKEFIKFNIENLTK